MTKPEKSWQKRLSGSVDELAVNFVESLSFDWRLYKVDIVGSMAHAEMLAARELISREELAQIKKGLIEIGDEIAAGTFAFDLAQEDIHMAIEAALIAKIGPAGKKLHTGRSRNDQVATDLRLWLRDDIDIVRKHITALQRALLTLAENHIDHVMPAYTHLQRAQPASIACPATIGWARWRCV